MTFYLRDYTPFSHWILSTHLDFDLYEDHTIVTSEVRYQLSIDNGQLTSIFLYGEELQLLSISVDGTPLDESRYTLREQGIEIFDVPDEFLLTIVTEIHPENNLTLEGLYRSGGKFVTQCEAEGFRRITYYPDRPDVMSIFTVRIEADREKYPILLSNGNLVDNGQLTTDNGQLSRHFAVWHDPFPKPSYLFALVAGDLDSIEDTFTTMSGRVVVLRIFTETHHIPKCHFAMESLKRAMRWDEERFGREYDLDIFMIVAVDDFNAGAMENKGLNIFNSRLIFATPESATDQDFTDVEAVIGHEYFHNWTGDRITCRDWFQLSLKEGLTVYRDAEFTADMHSRSVKRIEDVQFLREKQFAEDAGPMAHPIRPQSFDEINNFYTLTVYEKGAEVIRMYETILGREGFRRGMDYYFETYDGQAVTTEDFLSAMIGGNSMTVGQYDSMTEKKRVREDPLGGGDTKVVSNGVEKLPQMQTWYDQAGTPTVRVETEYDSQGKTYSIHFSQSTRPTPECLEKQPFLIPIKWGLLDRGTGQETHSGLFLLSTASDTLVIEGVECEVVPSLLRDFSAPVRIDYQYTSEELSLLALYDTDPFTRYEAVQAMMTRVLLGYYFGDDRRNDLDSLLSLISTLLMDDSIDPAWRALALTVPSEQELMNHLDSDIDPVKLIESRDFLMHTIASTHLDSFSVIFSQLDLPTPYTFSASEVARRRLRSLCLSYLSEVWEGEYLLRFLDRSDNMTDYFTVFSLLVDGGGATRQIALDHFSTRWGSDTVVMNKWFSTQARSRSVTIGDLDSLRTSSYYDEKNPNKIRSLCSAFAMNNLRNFHRADGSGYQWVADRVIEVDAFNPQVSSRLAKSLVSWKSLESSRGELLRGQLQRILTTKSLSSVTREVVERGLEG